MLFGQEFVVVRFLLGWSIKMSIVLFVKRCSFKLEKLFNEKSGFICEKKFDGERVQLHKHKGSFRYFSRSGREYSNIYGRSKLAGNLTPYIAEAIKADKVIIDGEMIGYDVKRKLYSNIFT